LPFLSRCLPPTHSLINLSLLTVSTTAVVLYSTYFTYLQLQSSRMARLLFPGYYPVINSLSDNYTYLLRLLQAYVLSHYSFSTCTICSSRLKSLALLTNTATRPMVVYYLIPPSHSYCLSLLLCLEWYNASITPRVHSAVTKRIQCRLHYRPSATVEYVC